MKQVALLLLAGCATTCPPSPVSTSMRSIVERLASDDFAGRMTGEAGEQSALAYIESVWPANLAPFLPDGARQPFEFKHGGTGIKGTNLIGCVKGTASPYDVVIIGAHFDHLGTGKGGAIAHGADDNASGTAVLIELAHRFAARPASRTIVIAHFSGEELGILGSKHFAASVPKTWSMVAMLNMDMVGRMRDDKLVVLGADTSDAWARILEDSNKGGLKLSLGKGGIGPSDHTSFYLKQVPVLHFFTGSHADYHKTTDTADKINVEGMAKVADLVEAVARRVANGARPAFVKSTADTTPKEGPPPSGARPSLGAMPSYADMSMMVVDAVSPGSPAEKAGIKEGDRFLAMNGKAIESLQDYSDRLMAHKPGDELELNVLRDGKTLLVKLTLAARP